MGKNNHLSILGGNILAKNKPVNDEIQSKQLLTLTLGEELLSPPSGSERNDTIRCVDDSRGLV